MENYLPENNLQLSEMKVSDLLKLVNSDCSVNISFSKTHTLQNQESQAKQNYPKQKRNRIKKKRTDFANQQYLMFVALENYVKANNSFASFPDIQSGFSQSTCLPANRRFLVYS